ncbi:glycosyltransferase family A protein [Hymenobacter sp. CRA2]|uniref:glycosyltransferase family A protein n=1 Tax=Hymenobacter sp. CRA2 TaxID=1955620 RepID=UPI0009CBAA47|nr:glycosyltransferase family A protein [Hymenobacter sp. CRA2]OON67332.1 hypothetical protein B0919_17820 [Hymenobacter sp. CRA2]
MNSAAHTSAASTSNYRITYVVTTYNKLPYLQQVLGRLVAARQADEEIVVCDGGSKDGTGAYLQQLHEAGQIQQFVSEPDKGEAHGFNKGLLMAQGEFVKFITDDDAFHYPAIRRAAAFMQQHPEVDVAVSYSAGTYLDNPGEAYILHGPRQEFERWLDDQTPFWMVGLSLLIRRRSLALTGFLYTGMVLVDMEYILRMTSVGANIGWYTGVMSMHVANPNGNFSKMKQEAIKEEGLRAHAFYLGHARQRRSMKAIQRDVMEALKKPIRPLKRAIFARLGLAQIQHRQGIETGYVPQEGEDALTAVYRVCDEFLTAQNEGVETEFIFRGNRK